MCKCSDAACVEKFKSETDNVVADPTFTEVQSKKQAVKRKKEEAKTTEKDEVAGTGKEEKVVNKRRKPAEPLPVVSKPTEPLPVVSKPKVRKSASPAVVMAEPAGKQVKPPAAEAEPAGMEVELPAVEKEPAGKQPVLAAHKKRVEKISIGTSEENSSSPAPVVNGRVSVTSTDLFTNNTQEADTQIDTPGDGGGGGGDDDDGADDDAATSARPIKPAALSRVHSMPTAQYLSAKDLNKAAEDRMDSEALVVPDNPRLLEGSRIEVVERDQQSASVNAMLVDKRPEFGCHFDTNTSREVYEVEAFKVLTRVAVHTVLEETVAERHMETLLVILALEGYFDDGNILERITSYG